MKLKPNLPAILDLFTSDNPTWAKITQAAGLLLSVAGTAVTMSNPATLPVGIIKLAPTAVLIGNFVTLIFQAPKKVDK